MHPACKLKWMGSSGTVEGLGRNKKRESLVDASLVLPGLMFFPV